MLRNNFRTKLLAILAVPMAALIGITAFAGYDRLSESRDANKLRHRIDIVAAGAAVAHQAQLEQAVSADVVANPAGPRDQLTAQRAATDAAVAAYDRAVQQAGDVGSVAFNAGADRVRRNLNALTTSYRGSVDLGSDINSVTSSYSEIGSSISDLMGVVADEAHDPGLAREASALSALSHAKDATAKEWAVLEVSLNRGSFKDAEEGTFRSAVAERDRWLGIHDGLATPQSRSDMQTRMSGSAISVSDKIESNALAVNNPVTPVTADPTQSPAAGAALWQDSMKTRLGIENQVLTNDMAHIAGHASALHSAASKDLQTFLLIAAGAVLVSILLALLLARAVTTPLRELTSAADRLAEEQLPALVNQLRDPGEAGAADVATTITPIEVRSSDEIGQLAQAFNTVQTVAVDVAAEQAATLRKGISDLFVNLARRNQVLIDRQIEFLDELEATEDDPDQLAQLYRLDHLATRMRRNAESLLVLAGSEPARSRTRPVPLFDVVRAAIGEVEDFARVDLTAFDDIDVTGNSAVDLGHLLAELMDNAAHFSPPDSRVTVEGRHGHAGYVISIRDSGIGMSEEQLAEANELLSSPPPVGLALGRSLGFTVVARLAARYGASVRLLPGEKTGTSAIVHLPQSLIVSPPDLIGATGAEDSSEDNAAWAPVAPAGDEDAVDVEEMDGADQPEEPARTPKHVVADDDPALDVESEVEERPDLVRGLEAGDDDEFESLLRTAWGESDPEIGEQELETTAPSADTDSPEAAPPEPIVSEPIVSEPIVSEPAALTPLPQRKREPVPAAAPDLFAQSPSTLHEALPQGQNFEQGLLKLVQGESALGPAGLIEPPIGPIETPPAVPPAAPAPGESDAVPSVTAAGLTRRVPRAETNEFEGVDRFHAAQSGPSILATKRSPEDVRAMLARYRSGLSRGRGGEESTDNPSGRDM
jgi:signal transduction histidine kinase